MRYGLHGWRGQQPAAAVAVAVVANGLILIVHAACLGDGQRFVEAQARTIMLICIDIGEHGDEEFRLLFLVR